MRVSTREDLERLERERLSPDATFASTSVGRLVPEEPDALRTCFQCDRDRILHSKSFRRLAHKTQVFLAPEGDHYRTRLIHSLEVAQVARSIARPLGLNEDLTEAIALGHDLGHTPFGHVGERALSHAIACWRGLDPDAPEARRLFAHNEQSARIVELLERDGAGLNLTREVVDGIRCHTGSLRASTPEGRVVALADRIAYVCHDIDAAARAGLGAVPNIALIEPLSAVDMHRLIARSYLVMTDSGGLQEEAPALGKPVLVLRGTTERPEAVEAGTVVLAGTEEGRICALANELLHSGEAYERMARAVNPYGDGHASARIADAIEYEFGLRDEPPGEVRL